jgi:hypothetical protein
LTTEAQNEFFNEVLEEEEDEVRKDAAKLLNTKNCRAATKQ